MLSTLAMQILEIRCEDPKVSTEELATMTGSDRETNDHNRPLLEGCIT